jgi:hypothetical protein
MADGGGDYALLPPTDDQSQIGGGIVHLEAAAAAAVEAEVDRLDAEAWQEARIGPLSLASVVSLLRRCTAAATALPGAATRCQLGSRPSAVQLGPTAQVYYLSCAPRSLGSCAL